MKKYLLSFAVLMMTALAFTACSNDDDEEGGNGTSTTASLAKTSWKTTVSGEGNSGTMTISFNSDKEGVTYTEAVEDGEAWKQYVSFTYTFNGNKGTLVGKKFVDIDDDGTESGTFDSDDNMVINFDYDSKNKKIIVVDDGQKLEFKKISYVELKMPK